MPRNTRKNFEVAKQELVAEEIEEIADVEVEDYTTPIEANEPVANIKVMSSNLNGVEISGEIIPKLIDEIPIIIIAASIANGATFIKNAEDAKESGADIIGSDDLVQKIQDGFLDFDRVIEYPDLMVSVSKMSLIHI